MIPAPSPPTDLSPRTQRRIRTAVRTTFVLIAATAAAASVRSSYGADSIADYVTAAAFATVAGLFGTPALTRLAQRLRR